jgi:hypothetical protein
MKPRLCLYESDWYIFNGYSGPECNGPGACLHAPPNAPNIPKWHIASNVPNSGIVEDGYNITIFEYAFFHELEVRISGWPADSTGDRIIIGLFTSINWYTPTEERRRRDELCLAGHESLHKAYGFVPIDRGIYRTTVSIADLRLQL